MIARSDHLPPPNRGKWLARIGVALYTGPIWGVLGTVVGMIGAFNTLAEQTEVAPQDLAEDIGFAMRTSLMGLIIGFVGVILILVALMHAKNREKWFFRVTVFLSLFWCVVLFPLGLVVGLPILILFVRKRAEFGPTATEAAG